MYFRRYNLGHRPPCVINCAGVLICPLFLVVFEEGDLGAMYKAPIDISFVGNLETAKIKGKNRKKWLLVNVQVREPQFSDYNEDSECLRLD